MTSRRSFLTGAAATLIGFAAPAIVRAESIMPIFVPKPMAPSVLLQGPHGVVGVTLEEYDRAMRPWLTWAELADEFYPRRIVGARA